MITIQNLQKSMGERLLFENVNLQLMGNRYGLVGANGSGKTTLLKILVGEEAQTDGTIQLPKNPKIGFLHQDQFKSDDELILKCVMRGAKEVFDALEERKKLQSQTPIDILHLAQLEDFIAHHNGYALEAKAASILEGLGISKGWHQKPLNALSGGYKLRVLLAQLLVEQKDILLLDEPTNHLDIMSIAWLERYLSHYEGCLILISHDRSFLDGVCNYILDVDYQTIKQYKGNYSQFIQQKELAEAQKKAEIERLKTEISHKQAYIDRFRYKASKARQAQSRLKQIEKIEIPNLPTSTRRAPHFKFEQKRPSGKDVLEVKNLTKTYGEHTVLKNVGFAIKQKERVAIIGPNGVGKSTLLKALLDLIPVDSGHTKWGYETQSGYFAQGHESVKRSEADTLEAWLWQFCPGQSQGFVRSWLGRVLFTRDDVLKPLKALSGGELARLDLARLMLEEPNVLVLDEPTNHLDMEAIEALVVALKHYAGTLIFVSHDRFFVSALANRIIEITPHEVKDLKGTYEDYLKEQNIDYLSASSVLKNTPKDVDLEKEQRKQNYLDNKKKSTEQKKREKELLKIQEDIEALEQKKIQLEQALCEAAELIIKSPATYQEQMKTLKAQQEEIDLALSKLWEKWEQLENI